MDSHKPNCKRKSDETSRRSPEAKTMKSNFEHDIDIKYDSMFTDLSQCFKDELLELDTNATNATNQLESEDIFADDEYFDLNIKKGSHSTPLITKLSQNVRKHNPEQPSTSSRFFKKITLESLKSHHEDPFNESLNMSFCKLDNMHTKNLEKKALNENSKVEDLSRIAESSQYRKEVLEAFDGCEMTICQLNEDPFAEDLESKELDQNTLLGNTTVWERSVLNKVELSDVGDSFIKNIPQDISKLVNGQINDVNSENTTKSNRTPMNANELSGEFYGLPLSVKSLMQQYKGISKLHDWQEECLNLPSIMKRENLIYALPTSGGKTLVAEILMLREVVCRKKNVIFVLPFVSIVQEKVWALSPFAVGLNFLVEEYAAGKGVFPPRKRRHKKSIYIATLEKGLSLLRSLWENKRLDEIGLVVVDELHLVGEPTRGCTLEMMLTNIVYSKENIQIIGMSATIGNIDELAKFLNAHIYTKDFRPVELKEYVKINENIMQIQWNAESPDEKAIFSRKVDFGYSPQIQKIDPDHLGGLVMEVIPKGSCLIFCATKKNCENVAILLCKVIFKQLLEYRAEEKSLLIKSLKAEGGSEEDILISLIPWGVAYHHSGLATEERRLIEDAFRAGILNVICCTSTLAAGVNLPAQRVILRAPMVGRNFISLSTYKQMVGRAGRAGFGGHGDSILICNSTQIAKFKALINSPMDKAVSNLHGNNGANMRGFVLGAIALQMASTRKSLRLLIESSLLFVQAEWMKVDLKPLLDDTIASLFKMGAIEKKSVVKVSDDVSLPNMCITPCTRQSLERVSDKNLSNNVPNNEITISNDTELTVSRLGKAAVKGAIELQRAHMLYADLKVAQNHLVVIGVLHLLYLVTPYDVAEVINPHLYTYHILLKKLNSEAKYVSKVIGFNEYISVQMAMGKMPNTISGRVLKRFYVTLMLYDLWNQESLTSVSEKFEVDRGMVQNLMMSVITFASSVLRFCEKLEEFWAFKDLLTNFNQRLSHFCTVELVPLMELPSVKKNRAMQLYRAGYKTIQAIALAKPIDLAESIEHLNRNVANQLIASAKLLLLEKVENLREEAEDVMIGLVN